jgi:hypothetical protein
MKARDTGEVEQHHQKMRHPLSRARPLDASPIPYPLFLWMCLLMFVLMLMTAHEAHETGGVESTTKEAAPPKDVPPPLPSPRLDPDRPRLTRQGSQ